MGSCSERQSDRPALHMQQMRPPSEEAVLAVHELTKGKGAVGLLLKPAAQGFSLLAKSRVATSLRGCHSSLEIAPCKKPLIPRARH